MRVVVIGGWAPSLRAFRGPLLAAMVRAGHEVHALAPGGTSELEAQLADLGVRFEELALDRAGFDPLADLRALGALVRRLRSIRPELVLSYTIKPVIYGSVAAHLAGVPLRAALITGLGYAFAGTPTTVRHWATAQLATRLYRYALALCQTVFLQNPDDHRELVHRRVLRSTARVAIVRGSGVDLEHYAVSPMPAPPVRFLFMGRLLRDKGIYEYIEMARRVRARHPATRFDVLGWRDSNPASVSSEELATWESEGTIAYLGSASDVRPHLATAHVLVLPSYREGTPRAVLEAMSMARAIITTDVPGCRETVVHGESGLVVPARSATALADAAIQLLETPELLDTLASAARARAVALYDAHAVAAHMMSILGL